MSGTGDKAAPKGELGMSLTVAVQMDPIETISIAGDSTFALMIEAQKRGHHVWHYEAGDLSYRDGRVVAVARSVTVQRVGLLKR